MIRHAHYIKPWQLYPAPFIKYTDSSSLETLCVSTSKFAIIIDLNSNKTKAHDCCYLLLVSSTVVSDTGDGRFERFLAYLGYEKVIEDSSVSLSKCTYSIQ